METIYPALRSIEDFVAARLPRWDAPGVVVALTDRDHTLGILPAGAADVASGRPMYEDDRLQIGSISKSFTAILTMQEVEAGRLDLHTPVTEYVPWFEVRSAFAPICLHDLLTHTSGLTAGTDFGLCGRHQVWALRNTECVAAPGQHFLYSNDAYKLVGLVLEAVTGKPVTRLLRERIFNPLGMSHSDPCFTLETRATVALPHQRIFDDRPSHAGQPWMTSPWYECDTPDGSIVSTADDLCAYARLLLAHGGLPEAKRLFSEESWALLTQRVVEDLDEPGTWYGYGLATRELDGRTLIGHSGSMVGYSSYLMLDPQADLAAVILMNGIEDRMELLRYTLAATRAVRVGTPVPPPPPPGDPTRIDDADSYAGTYVLRRSQFEAEALSRSGDSGVEDRLTLVAERGCLFLQAGDASVALECRERDVFVAPHPVWDRFYLHAGRNGAGKVVEFFHGPRHYAGDECTDEPHDALPEEWRAFVGHYRSWNPMLPDLRVFTRKGSLLLSSPLLDGPAGELELVPLGPALFRVGAKEWLPDRLRFETVVDGQATCLLYNQTPLYRTFTP